MKIFLFILVFSFIFASCNDTQPSPLQLYPTCGDPVCHTPDVNNSGLAPCTTQTAGDSCTQEDQDICYVGCGSSVLRCTRTNPATMCPI